MAYRDVKMSPHSIALDNFGAMDEQVDSLIDPYVPLSQPEAADISSLTIIITHLPFIVSTQDNSWTVTRPDYAAYLAGLHGLNCRSVKWVGLLNTPVEEKDQEGVTEVLRDYGVFPVYVDAQTLEDGIVRFAESVRTISEAVVSVPLLHSQHRRQRRAFFRGLYQGVAGLQDCQQDAGADGRQGD